jgi:hypothetical protein
MVSLRPYPPADLDAMWTESSARYEGDLLVNGGLDAARRAGGALAGDAPYRAERVRRQRGRVARSLYRGAVYAETSVHMAKPL